MRRRTALALTLALTSACPVPEPVRERLAAVLATDADGNPNPNAPPAVLNDHGNDLDDAGKHEEALRFYDAALQRYPLNDVEGRSGCLFNKGVALRRMQRWEQSVAAYEAAYALVPRPGIAINISFPLRKLGRVDDALAYLDRELVGHPDDIPLIETKAGLLIEAGRHADARPVVEQALAIRENSGRPEDRRYVESWRHYLATQ